MNPIHKICALAALALASSADAAVFCVTTPAEFASALATAASNGQSDIIKVHQGNYLLTQPLSYSSATTENHDLNISGGWLSIPTACAVQFADASVTVLDGQNQVGGLYLSMNVTSPGTYTVSNLTITRTVPSTPTFSAGLFGNFVNATSAGTFDVFNLIIRNNSSVLANEVGIGTLGRVNVRVRNTLVAENQSPGFVGIYTNSVGAGSVYLQHLTIANNQSTGTAYAGVKVGGDALLTMENSILWGNTSANPQGNCPLEVSNVDRLRFVIATTVCGQQAGANIGVNSFNPQFKDADFRLGLNSPGLNVGMNPPTFPLIPKDLDNHDRVVGSKPDLGAYESIDTFRNGFE
ncbi:MAG: hypothetical protein AB7E72_03230 [Lysobacterales bacterium]